MFCNYAHRGFSECYPENTREAFDAGIEAGANALECDIRRSADGVLFLFHDDTMERVLHRAGRPEELSYPELSKALVYHRNPAVTPGKIMTLDAFLARYAHRSLTLALELKSDDTHDAILDALERAHAREDCILTSFSEERLKKARASDSGIRLGYLTPNPDAAIPFLKSIQAYEVCPCADLVDRALTEKFHALGFSVRAYGVRDEALMRACVDAGADGMTVNFPQKLTALLRENTPR